MTQGMFPAGLLAFATADQVRSESVITVTGRVVPREAGLCDRLVRLIGHRRRELDRTDVTLRYATHATQPQARGTAR